MGRRTLTATEMTFHQKYKREPATFAPSDLLGDDLLDIFEKWCDCLGPEETHDPGRQSWIRVSTVLRPAPRVILVLLQIGAYGEPGPVVDAVNGETVFTLTDSQAPTGENRVLLFVPETGESAYYLAEQSTRGGAGSHLLKLFKNHFSQRTDKITMTTETVAEGEAWADEARLREIEVRVKGMSTDLADGVSVEVGTLSHIARAGRSKVFSSELLRRILGDRSLAQKVVGIPVPEDDPEIYVTLEREGRQKKFLLGVDSGTPSLRLVLNEAGESSLSADQLLSVCTERVSDLADRTGGHWSSDWSAPLKE